MSHETERVALSSLFSTLWNEPVNGPIARQNIDFQTPANSMFVGTYILDRGTSRRSLGVPAFKRHIKTFQIDIYTPSGLGTKKSRQLAEQLEEAYQDLVVSLPDGETVIFGTPSSRVLAPNEQRAANLDDNWDRYVIECPFYRDQIM